MGILDVSQNKTGISGRFSGEISNKNFLLNWSLDLRVKVDYLESVHPSTDSTVFPIKHTALPYRDVLQAFHSASYLSFRWVEEDEQHVLMGVFRPNIRSCHFEGESVARHMQILLKPSIEAVAPSPLASDQVPFVIMAESGHSS